MSAIVSASAGQSGARPRGGAGKTRCSTISPWASVRSTRTSPSGDVSVPRRRPLASGSGVAVAGEGASPGTRAFSAWPSCAGDGHSGALVGGVAAGAKASKTAKTSVVSCPSTPPIITEVRLPRSSVAARDESAHPFGEELGAREEREHEEGAARQIEEIARVNEHAVLGEQRDRPGLVA